MLDYRNTTSHIYLAEGFAEWAYAEIRRLTPAIRSLVSLLASQLDTADPDGAGSD